MEDLSDKLVRHMTGGIHQRSWTRSKDAEAETGRAGMTWETKAQEMSGESRREAERCGCFPLRAVLWLVCMRASHGIKAEMTFGLCRYDMACNDSPKQTNKQTNKN